MAIKRSITLVTYPSCGLKENKIDYSTLAQHEAWLSKRGLLRVMPTEICIILVCASAHPIYIILYFTALAKNGGHKVRYLLLPHLPVEMLLLLLLPFQLLFPKLLRVCMRRFLKLEHVRLLLANKVATITIPTITCLYAKQR